MSLTVNRIDPADCGCTDCLTGWSEPMSDDPKTRQEQAWLVSMGFATNATGLPLVLDFRVVR